MADELIDIFDEHMNFLGIVNKSQAHSEGLWHQAFHCWIVKRNNTGNNIWLQLRSKHVGNHPGLLDISSAGHLKSGENAHSGIHKIEEELGLSIDFEKLTKLFTRKRIYDRENYHNREFNPTYLLETDKSLSDLTLRHEEVGAVFEADLDDLLNLFNGKVDKIYCSGIICNEQDKIELKTGYFTADEFVPHGHDYYLKAFNTIKRHCEGAGKDDEEF